MRGISISQLLLILCLVSTGLAIANALYLHSPVAGLLFGMAAGSSGVNSYLLRGE